MEFSRQALSEVALILRSLGLNIAGDKELLNYMWHVLGFPNMTDDVFEEVYKPQATGKSETSEDNGVDAPDGMDDSADKLLEQNDLRYT